MTHKECRIRAHNGARYVRNLQNSNPFAATSILRMLRELEEAYFSPYCEARVANKLRAYMDQIEHFA